jgi:hypothetical protein
MFNGPTIAHSSDGVNGFGVGDLSQDYFSPLDEKWILWYLMSEHSLIVFRMSMYEDNT